MITQASVGENSLRFITALVGVGLYLTLGTEEGVFLLIGYLEPRLILL